MSGDVTADSWTGGRFPAEGMTCASSVNRSERYLRNIDGVTKSGINA